MLRLRLTRVGKKNVVFFRIVLAEKSAAVKGKFIEILGHYNPRTKEFKIKEERLKYWLSQGAKSSITLHNLLVREKIIEGPKIKVKIAKKAEKEKPVPEVKTEKEKETPPGEKAEEKPKEEKPKELKTKEEQKKPGPEEKTEEPKPEKS